MFKVFMSFLKLNKTKTALHKSLGISILSVLLNEMEKKNLIKYKVDGIKYIFYSRWLSDMATVLLLFKTISTYLHYWYIKMLSYVLKWIRFLSKKHTKSSAKFCFLDNQDKSIIFVCWYKNRLNSSN